MYFCSVCNMTRLDKEIHEDLSQAVLERLFAKSIFTTTEFVQTESKILSGITGFAYSKILLLKNVILHKFSSPISYGHDCYSELLTRGAIISTGIKKLDDLLGGGFLTGNIYEVCGSSASGKTQLCMTVASQISAKLEKQSTLFIDTKNDITAHRLYEIIQCLQIKARDIDVLMLRIKIYHTKSAYELLSLLQKIAQKLTINKNECRVIMIDSFTALFHHFLGEMQKKGLSLLNNITSILKYIAREFHVIILVTNLITSWTSESNFSVVTDEENCFPLGTKITIQPALGKYWTHIPNTRIIVQKLNTSNECLLTILKSCNEPTGKTIKVSLSNNGLI